MRMSSVLDKTAVRLPSALDKRVVRLSSALDKQRVCLVHWTHSVVKCGRQGDSGARQMAPIAMQLSRAMYSDALIVSSAHTLKLVCVQA